MKRKQLVPGDDYIIKEAIIKDDFCNYALYVVSGVGSGDTHSVKGSGIIEEDMRDAFAKLNVHLACIDDAFKYSGIEIDDVDKFHIHELTQCYSVHGIKIRGNKDNETVIILGNKYVSSAGGRIDLATPKIPLDGLSSYKWYKELCTAVADIRREVALYKEGKYTAVEEEEEEEDPKQMKITDMIDKG